MDKLILQPNYIDTCNNNVVFLAGPIQGALNWHSEAIKIFKKEAPDLYIACPKRPNFVSEDDISYKKQVEWETHYLREAYYSGVIMFWLAEEVEHFPKRAYAQTSRFELGEWVAKEKETQGRSLVVGIHPNFSGRRYIELRLTEGYSSVHCPNIPIMNDLESTCRTTVEYIGK